MREFCILIGGEPSARNNLFHGMTQGLITPPVSRLVYRETSNNGEWLLAGHRRQENHLHLGHCLAEHGPYTILADLDNRIQTKLQRRLGDESLRGAALVAAGFARFGMHLPRYLRGSYSLVIWDARAKQLTAALDPMGAKTLFYHHLGQDTWAVASHARTLRQLKPNPAEEPRAAMMWSLNEYDTRFSMWQGIHGLRPGEWRRLSQSTSPTQRRFPIHRDNRRPFSESLLWETLETCIAERTSEPKATHSMLSGGLDSSTIAAVFKNRHGFAPVCHGFAFETLTDCAEQSFSRTTAAELETSLHLYNAEQFPLFSRLENSDPPENPYQPGQDLEYAVLKRVAELGGTTLFTGHGGDTLFANPPPSSLARRPWRLSPATNRTLFTKTKRAWQLWMAHWLPQSIQHLKQKGRGRWSRHPAWLRQTPLQQADPWSQFDIMPLRTGPDPLTFFLHTRMTRDAAGIRRAVHWFNRASLKTGVHVAHPLFDERLADLMLSVPRTIWRRHLRPKGLLRDLLEQKMHLSVCQRLEKPTLTAYYHAGLCREAAFLKAESGRLDGAQHPWFNQEEFCREIERFCASKPPYPTADFLSAAWYLVWLSQDFTSI